jgi:hypothetical protein
MGPTGTQGDPGADGLDGPTGPTGPAVLAQRDIASGTPVTFGTGVGAAFAECPPAPAGFAYLIVGGGFVMSNNNAEIRHSRYVPASGPDPERWEVSAQYFSAVGTTTLTAQAVCILVSS